VEDSDSVSLGSNPSPPARHFLDFSTIFLSVNPAGRNGRRTTDSQKSAQCVPHPFSADRPHWLSPTPAEVEPRTTGRGPAGACSENPGDAAWQRTSFGASRRFKSCHPTNEITALLQQLEGSVNLTGCRMQRGGNIIVGHLSNGQIREYQMLSA
jgi:hypothetical protein